MELNPGAEEIVLNGTMAGASSDGNLPTRTVRNIETVIDPAGDIILRTGEKSILVSSKILTVASPVFQAMFGPHFKEGEALSSSTVPIEIPLPDDKPSDVENLCRILHWKVESGRPAPGPDSNVNVVEALQELKDLAILSDKYECSDSVSTVTTPALEFLENFAVDTERVSLLETAYVLDHAAIFERASKKMITEDEGKILELLQGWNSEKILPIRVCLALLKQRNNLFSALQNGLDEIAASLLRKEHYEVTSTLQNKEYARINHTGRHFGVHDAFVISAYFRELTRIGLWPTSAMREKSLTTLLNKFHEYIDRNITQQLGFGVFVRSRDCWACMIDISSQLATLQTKLLAQVKGLCLDCLENDKSADPSATCRIEHT